MDSPPRVLTPPASPKGSDVLCHPLLIHQGARGLSEAQRRHRGGGHEDLRGFGLRQVPPCPQRGPQIHESEGCRVRQPCSLQREKGRDVISTYAMNIYSKYEPTTTAKQCAVFAWRKLH